MYIYKSLSSGRISLRFSNETPRKLKILHLNFPFDPENHDRLKQLSGILPDFDLNPVLSLAGVAARKSFGITNEAELEMAFNYVCAELSQSGLDRYQEEFLAKCFDHLEPSTEQKVYLRLLRGDL